MVPTFKDGQFLLTDKISYRVGEPERGDIIVFKAPPDFREEFIKRIIAMPGDTVGVLRGDVILNGEVLSEPYLPEDFHSLPGRFAREGQTFTVPENSFFVLGDNRSHSLDSRAFGFIDREKITGRAWFNYWPPSEIGIIKSE